MALENFGALCNGEFRPDIDFGPDCVFAVRSGHNPACHVGGAACIPLPKQVQFVGIIVVPSTRTGVSF